MRKITTIILTIMLLLSITTAQAIRGESLCEGAITGEAVFLLDNSGRILGALAPDEDQLTLRSFQHSARTSPIRIREDQCLRWHAWTPVRLDDQRRVIDGGTTLTIAVQLSDPETVLSIAGELTAAAIIDATIYSPNLCAETPRAAHIFLPAKARERQVGKIIFRDGAVLALYVGDFDGDGSPDLGFRALVLAVSDGCHCGDKCSCKPGECKCGDDCKCKCKTPAPKPKKPAVKKTCEKCGCFVCCCRPAITLKICFSLSIKPGCLCK